MTQAIKKRTFKVLFSLESNSKVTHSCHLVSQSNYLSNSNKVCDWLTEFQRALSENSIRMTPFLLLWKIKFGLKIQ